MTTPQPIDPCLLNRVTRFIYTGLEIPKYYPGCWATHNYFEEDKLKAVDEILERNKENIIELVNLIVKAYKDGFYTRYETIAFALAKCLLVGTPTVKEAVYKVVPEICATPEQLMLFSKYTRIMKTGNGQGWCKSVRTWYSTKDPMELAKEVTRIRARHGRSHKTLIMKSHLKVEENDIARDAVVKYSIFGLKRAKQMMANKEGVKEIFDYIQKVEDIRHCEDPVAAAIIAQENQFLLDHVPGHLLTSMFVWNAVLPQFSLGELLQNLQRIHNMGFLGEHSQTTAIILSLLSDKKYINKSKVTPLEVQIVINNYINKCRPFKHEKARMAVEKQKKRRTRQVFDANTGVWKWNDGRRHPKELKYLGAEDAPNQAVVAALHKLIDHTWLLTPPTGARYMITLDMRPHMFKGRQLCKPYPATKKGKQVNGKPEAEATATAPADSVPAPATAPAPATEAAAEEVEKKSNRRLLAECFFNKNITPGHAAIVLALQILKREQHVQLAVFSDDGVQAVSIDKNSCGVQEAEFILRKAKLGRVQLDAPILWASCNKSKVDVFINMIDRPSRFTELEAAERGGRGPAGRFGPPPAKGEPDRCPVRALLKYRQINNNPDAKLVVMSLASHRSQTTDGSHAGVLDVVGVDEHVPRVLDAFARGLFK